jgi:prophage maintenance system killer protein
MILSVGYRVKSSEGVRFRVWANSVLKEYLLKGVAVNQKRLGELNKILEVIERSKNDEVAGVASVLRGYTRALDVLAAYDDGRLAPPKGKAAKWVLSYKEARRFLDAAEYRKTSDNFARERNGAFKGILKTIYQTYDGKELYPTAQEKAASLLYFIVKDHPFIDGNKRSAAALFVYFLDRNGALRDADGGQIIANNTLAAITLMVALSKPSEKEQMILLVRNLLV